jgi:hypothetical protein
VLQLPRIRRRLAGIVLAVAMLASAAFASGAQAVGKADFNDCPTASAFCILQISQPGSFINIKGFNVPLNRPMTIQGGLSSSFAFIPPADGGFTALPVIVPGGLLGLNLGGLNQVLATAKLAGTINVDLTGADTLVTIPIKLKLDNPLLGSNCFIGSNSNPTTLHLTTGTTAPPPPNSPITGSTGTPVANPDPNIGETDGIVFVDNAFAAPAATGCGLFGILSPLVNLRLKLPSAAGNNTISAINNQYFALASYIHS